MPNNFHNDTSYKYRWNQKELVGKILSGTLDEDLCISNLLVTSNPASSWKLNPIFTGYCFSGKHKLNLGIEFSDWSVPQDFTSGMFQSSVNISALVLSIKYSGHLSTINQNITALCRYAVDLESVEVILADNVKFNGIGNAFYNCPALETVILRSSNAMALTGTQGISGIVDTIVLDSPAVASLGSSTMIDSSAFVSGGTGGTIYIPKSLYDHLGDGTSLDYKAATNWSTIDARGTITWAQIEGSEYEA